MKTYDCRLKQANHDIARIYQDEIFIFFIFQLTSHHFGNNNAYDSVILIQLYLNKSVRLIWFEL